MKIPVNPDRVQMRGIAQAPTRGHSVEAFGNYSGLDNFGKSLTGLGAAITKKSLEDDNARMMKAQNELTAAENKLLDDIRTNRQYEKAADADRYYEGEMAKIRKNVYANSGIKYRQTMKNFNYAADRTQTTGLNNVRTYQRGEEEKFIKREQQVFDNNQFGVAVDSGTEEGYRKMIDNIVTASDGQYGQTKGKTYVEADIAERVSKVTTAYWRTMIGKNPQLAQQALAYSKRSMDKGVYQQLEDKTREIVKENSLDALADQIVAQAGGGATEIVHLAQSSGYGNPQELIERSMKKQDSIDKINDKMEKEATGKLFRAVVYMDQFNSWIIGTENILWEVDGRKFDGLFRAAVWQPMIGKAFLAQETLRNEAQTNIREIWKEYTEAELWDMRETFIPVDAAQDRFTRMQMLVIAWNCGTEDNYRKLKEGRN